MHQNQSRLWTSQKSGQIVDIEVWDGIATVHTQATRQRGTVQLCCATMYIDGCKVTNDTRALRKSSEIEDISQSVSRMAIW
jgi:hypothetical protein